jgi:hypothetical protein
MTSLRRRGPRDLFLCYHSPFLWENMRGMLGDVCMLENIP